MRVVRWLALAVTLPACAALISVPDLTLDQSSPDAGADAGSTEAATALPDASGDQGAPPEAGADTGGPDASDASDAGRDACPANLLNDPANCGACGHDCTRGSCAGGVCTLMDTRGAQGIAFSDDAVFVAQNRAGLVRCAHNGCQSGTTPTLLAPVEPERPEPWLVEVVGDHVFATDLETANPGRLLRAPRGGADGGAYTRVPTGVAQERSYGLAVASDAIYWAEWTFPGDIFYCALPACSSATKVVTADWPERVSLTSDGKIVFTEFATDTLRFCATRSCSSGRLIPSDGSYPSALATAGTTAYWGGGGKLFSCNLEPLCTEPTIIYTDVANAQVSGMALTGTRIYWATVPRLGPSQYDNTAGTVKSCELATCAATLRVIATGQRSPQYVAVHGDSVYWTNSGEFDLYDKPGSLMKAPK